VIRVGSAVATRDGCEPAPGIKLFERMVDLAGIEPATSSMPWNVENLMLTARL
jgi:hypothetical protein